MYNPARDILIVEKIFLLISMLLLNIPTMQDPLRFVLAAGTGTLFLVSLIVLRIYLVSSSSFSCYSHFVSSVYGWKLAASPLKELIFRGQLQMPCINDDTNTLELSVAFWVSDNNKTVGLGSLRIHYSALLN